MPDHRFDYILFFQEPGRAEAALEADLEGRLGDMIRRIAADPDFLSDEDLRIYCEAFRRGGLTGPLNYYRNIDRNWETTAHLDAKQVLCPALMVCAEKDPILKPEMADGMESFVPNLRKVLIEDCGHWTQQEKPAEVNAALLEFLGDLAKP
jgi:soluble epoxide hydrolase/lipid-phosphate phosphatase